MASPYVGGMNKTANHLGSVGLHLKARAQSQRREAKSLGGAAGRLKSTSPPHLILLPSLGSRFSN